jgi:hypothetical protein
MRNKGDLERFPIQRNRETLQKAGALGINRQFSKLAHTRIRDVQR